MAELTQLGEILVGQLADGEQLITALIRASGGSITVPAECFDSDGYVLTRVDDAPMDAVIFSVRRGTWGAVEQPGKMCPSVHPKTLRDVRGPGGWRDRGLGYDHEHWTPVEPDTERPAGPRVDPRTLCAGCAGGHTYGDDCAWLPSVPQSEILPLSDQTEPAEPVLPRIRSLALLDGQFAFVVSGYQMPDNPDVARDFLDALTGLADRCGAVTTAVFADHIEVG